MSLLSEPTVSVETLLMLTFPADLPRVVGFFMAHLPVDLRQSVERLPAVPEDYDAPNSSPLGEIPQETARPIPHLERYPKSLDDPLLQDESWPEVPGTISEEGDSLTLPE
jgi:hypothetical protein